MKNLLIKFVEKIHLIVFKHPMSQEMRKFLGNLSWSFSIGIIVAPLTMLITTLAGRFIGPVEYGKYSLLLVINQFLLIFIFFGLDTIAVKNIAKATSFKDKKKLISAITYLIFFTLSILIILTAVAYPFLHKYLKSYTLFAVLTTFYTITVSTKIMFDLFIRGVENFKKQAFARIFEVIVILIVFSLIFFVFKQNNFVGFIFAVSAGAIAISIYYFMYFKKYFGKSNLATLRQLLTQSRLFFYYTLFGTIYMSSDRIFVTKYLGLETLGIYSAYYLSSFTIINSITQLFNNVFFPATVRLKDKSFSKKIDHLFKIGFIPFSIFAGALMLLMLLIFGKQYPINWIYILGFTLFSSSYFFLSLYYTVILDLPRHQYKKFIWINNIVNLLVIISFITAVYLHIFSIPFILVMLILNNLITIFVERRFIQQVRKDIPQ